MNTYNFIRTFDSIKFDKIELISDKKFISFKNRDWDLEKTEIEIFDLNTGVCLNKIEYEDNDDQYIQCISVISNELIVIGSTNGEIKLWNIEPGQCLQTMGENILYLDCIIKLSDEKIACCTENASIDVWNIKTGE